MPRLTIDNRDEFFDYVRRKVKELISFKEEMSVGMTARLNDITEHEAAALVNADSYHWKYFNSLIELAVKRELRIPIKMKGKIHNIADRALIRKLKVDASIGIGMLGTEVRKKVRDGFSESTVYGFDHGLDRDTGEVYVPSDFSVFCVYAVTHGAPDSTIIFPSGKLSKGKA